jgi:hypothetical protein
MQARIAEHRFRHRLNYPRLPRNRWIPGTVDFQPDIPADSVKVSKNVGVRFGLAAISAVLTRDSALE